MTAEVPARAVPGMRGPDTEHTGTGRKRDASRSSLVWDVLADVIAARVAESGRTALDIVDVGAGTGGFAVSIASQGHRVTVVDPSPDALAAAGWRAAETGVTLTEVQGEAVDLPALVGEPGTAGAGADRNGADLVICHNVLEYVDSPDAALAAIARVLRPGGTVSVLAANTVAAVLQRALAGKYAEALAMLPGSAEQAPDRQARCRQARPGAVGGPAVHPARADRADRRGRAAGRRRARHPDLLQPAAWRGRGPGGRRGAAGA